MGASCAGLRVSILAPPEEGAHPRRPHGFRFFNDVSILAPPEEGAHRGLATKFVVEKAVSILAPPEEGAHPWPCKKSHHARFGFNPRSPRRGSASIYHELMHFVYDVSILAPPEEGAHPHAADDGRLSAEVQSSLPPQRERIP